MQPPLLRHSLRLRAKESSTMNIVERAKAITLNPAATWPVIEAEQHTVQSVVVPYLLILAAIPAVATFIGMSVIGFGGFGFSMRLPFASGLSMMITTYVLSIVATVGMGWVVSALAPTFGGQNNLVQGVKLMVFGSTPMMLIGVVNIMPALGILALLAGLYGLYLAYLGLPVLMKNPPDKTIPYMLVLAVCSVVAAVVLTALSAMFMPSYGGLRLGNDSGLPAGLNINTPNGQGGISITPNAGAGSMSINSPDGKGSISITSSGAPGAAIGASAAAGDASVSIKTPDGEIKLDMKNMEAFAKQMEEMAKKMEQANKK